MKRFLSFLLVALMVMNMLCFNIFGENTVRASSNFVVNPGFEDDKAEVKMPAGWLVYDSGPIWGSPAYEGKITKEGQDAHSGSYYGRHYQDSAYIINTYQEINGLANGKYTLEAWVRSSGGQGAALMIAKVGTDGASDPNDRQCDIPQTNEWVKIEINDIEVSAGVVSIQFFSIASANQWIEFDDVALYKQKESGSPVLTQIENKTAYINEQLIFKIGVADANEDDDLIFSAEELPEDAVLDPATGIFSWIPVEGQEGKHSVTFKAENSKGEDSRTVVIKVKSPIPKTNLISNPGFEADKAEVKTPSGWETYAWTTGYNENHVKNGDAHSGSYYGRHYAVEDYSVTTYKVFNGLENGKYKLEAWVRSSGGQDVAILLAMFGDTTGPGKKELQCNIPQTNVWTKIEIDDIEVSAGFAQIQFLSFAKANQWIEFDDVMFYKTDMGLLEKVSDRDAYVNEPLEIKIAGAYVDEEIDTVTYSAIGLPTGSVLDSKTGIFSWIPEIDDVGEHSIIFEAMDDMGKSDSRTVKITVYKERTEVGIRNSGFEELDENGVPTGGWHAFGGWGSGFAAVEKTTVYEGQNSIRLGKGSEVNDPVWYRYILKDVKPGALYEVSAMINYNLESGGGPGFTILVEGYSGETADSAADYLQGDYPPYIGGNTNNQWVKYGGTIQAHNDAKTLVIYLFLNAPGTVYIDNVSLKLSGDGPEPYLFTTDQVFYYTDDKQGISHVEIDRYYKAEDEPYTATVDFELLDGAEVLKNQKDTKFDKGSKAEFVFDMALLSEKEKQYAIKAVVKKSTGEVIRTYTSEVYKYDRPTRLLADGTYLKDGKPYYPSIAYWPIDDYAKMKEVGINCIELGAYSMEQTMEALDRLQELDMTAIVSLFCGPAWMEPAGHPDNMTFTKEIVNAIKDHPAVFAYATMDEPLGAGLREERVQQMITSYKIIREIDKVHPIYVIDFKPSLYKESQKYCDIWAVDIYTYGDTSAVSSMGREGVGAAVGRKPTYWIGQTYKSNSYGLPNIKDVRGGIYRAFEVGIRGIGYYTIKAAIGQVGGEARVDLPDTHLWEPMMKFAQNEQEELFDYFVGKKYQTFNKHDDGGLRSFYYESWIHGDDIWVIAHNRGNSTIDAQVPLVSDDGVVNISKATAKAIGGTEADLDITDGTLRVAMGPQEVYLYKVTPESTEPETYTVTFDVDGVKTDVTVTTGGAIQLPTTPSKNGYTFKGWYTAATGGTKVTEFKSPMTVYAQWTKNSSSEETGGGNSGPLITYYTITATAGEGGKISPQSPSVVENTSKTFTITPDEGYEIADVTVDGKSIGAVATYTFNHVTSSHSIKATFKKVEPKTPEHKNPFADVNENHWFYDSVMYVYNHGLMSGISTDKFNPLEKGSRSMIVTILHTLAGKPEATVNEFAGANGFKDVADGQWYANAVTWAAENKIVSGYGNGLFGPNDQITREQMAVIFYNFTKHKGYDLSETLSLEKFADNAKVAGWASEAMQWMIGSGMMSGKGNDILDPKGTATRAEMASIMQKFVEKFGK